MPTRRTVEPTELPLLLPEVKAHLRVTTMTEDADIMAYLRGAVRYLDGPEGVLNRALCTQTLVHARDGFPYCYDKIGDGFDLPYPPVQSVTSVVYVDGAGIEQTLPTSIYRVLNLANPNACARIERVYGQSWPTARYQAQSVRVTYIAGYGARNDVPESTRLLILNVVKMAYDHREPLVASGVSRTVLSPAMQGLLDQARFPAEAF